MVLLNSLFLRVKESDMSAAQSWIGRSELTLQEQAPGAQEQLAQEQPEFPQPPMMMKCLFGGGRVGLSVLFGSWLEVVEADCLCWCS